MKVILERRVWVDSGVCGKEYTPCMNEQGHKISVSINVRIKHLTDPNYSPMCAKGVNQMFVLYVHNVYRQNR